MIFNFIIVLGLRDTTATFDDVIKSVFQQAKESIGKKLYRQMKRKARLDERDRAPNDITLFFDDDQKVPKTIKYDDLLTIKDNLHGLGYKGMINAGDYLFSAKPAQATSGKNANEASGSVMATMSGGRRLKITGAAFDYAAFDEDDDVAVYSKDDMSQYDFETGALQRSQEKTKTKRPFMNMNSSNDRVELEGFSKTSKNYSLFEKIKQKYKLEDLPKGWRPKTRQTNESKRSRWDIDKEGKKLLIPEDVSSTKGPQSLNTPKQETLNANLRAVILGEEVVHKQGVKSSGEANSRKLEFEQQSQPTPTPQQAATFQRPLMPSQPRSGILASKFTSSSTVSEQVTIIAGLTSFNELASNSAYHEQRRLPEVDEDKAAEKPKRTIYEWHPHKLVCKRFSLQNPYPQYQDIVGIVSIDGSKARNATAIIENVKAAGGDANKTKARQQQFGSLFANIEGLDKFTPAVTPVENASAQAPGSSQLLEFEVSLKAAPEAKTSVVRSILTERNIEDNEKEEEEPVERPPIDLFKSIFASDEEDEDEEAENSPPPPRQLSPQPNTAPAKDDLPETEEKRPKTLFKSAGIFSGLDFEQLHQFNPQVGTTTKPKPPTSDHNDASKDKEKSIDDDDDDEVYGPALPPASSLQPSMSSPAARHDRKRSRSPSPTPSRHHHHKSSHKKSKKKSKHAKKEKKKKKTKTKKKKASDRHRHSSDSSDSSTDTDHGLLRGGGHAKRDRR